MPEFDRLCRLRLVPTGKLIPYLVSATNKAVGLRRARRFWPSVVAIDKARKSIRLGRKRVKLAGRSLRPTTILEANEGEVCLPAKIGRHPFDPCDSDDDVDELKGGTQSALTSDPRPDAPMP